MATCKDCKDCLHYELCGVFDYISPDECGFYTDRSRFVELPCKVGDSVYIIHRYKKGGGFIQEVTVSGIHLRDTIGYRSLPRTEYLVVRGNCNLSKHVSLKEIGKTLFFTKIEAEQALVEQEQLNNTN